MLDRVVQIRNGIRLVNFKIFSCDICNNEIKESDSHIFELDRHYCMDCAFKTKRVSDQKYLYSCGINVTNYFAGINKNGEIEIWHGGKTPPWERVGHKQRNTPRYISWRKEVFKRDGYSCRKCGKIGGELNAHHIKPFKDYPDLRFDIHNGLTLCIECHKETHKNK